MSLLVPGKGGHLMKSTKRLLLTVCLAMLFVGYMVALARAAEGRALLVCTPEKCVSSWTRASDSGLVAEIVGDFQVDYKEFTISGVRGQFSQPPQDKSKATTRLRAVVTEAPRLAQSGTDAFELTAGDQIEIDLEDEHINATGGIRIHSKETLITAEQLVGGQPPQMRPLIEQACKDMEGRIAALVQEWLTKASPEDRLMLIEGNVKAVDPSFTFSGQKLVANISSEAYLFIGPHTMEMNIDEE
jgi:hypothetical protein